jgi:monoamine oxidase
MARTELFRQLRSLASAHRAARSRGMAIGEWRARRAELQGAMSRREMLNAVGAASVAAALATPMGKAFAASAADRRSARVAIVGAGIAGLNCALALADKGVRATIYEASNRVGGRMFTHRGYWPEGQISEWGGELIDSGHTTMRALARRFGLVLDDLSVASAPGATETFYFDNSYYPLAEVDRDFAPVFARVVAEEKSAPFPSVYDDISAAGRALDQLSIYDWIATRVPGGHQSRLGQLLNVGYTIELAADTREQSALNLIYLLAFQPEKDGTPFSLFGESDERFHIRGGNDSLTSAMAAHLPATVGSDVIAHGHHLQRIAQNASGVCTLDFDTPSGARSVSADLVVLALPFAVLRGLDYADAGFDGRKRNAIINQGRGTSSKLQLGFRDRFWRRSGPWGAASTGASNTDVGYQESWEVSRAQSGTHGIINLFSGGAVAENMFTTAAFATANVASVGADAVRGLGQFERVFPGASARWTGRATQALWQNNPLAQLSYSYYQPGQYSAFAGYEQVRQGNILFAGEHTSIEAQGYMEGGAEQGARAAKELLKRIGRV